MIQTQVDRVGCKRLGFADELTCVLGDNDCDPTAEHNEVKRNLFINYLKQSGLTRKPYREHKTPHKSENKQAAQTSTYRTRASVFGV